MRPLSWHSPVGGPDLHVDDSGGDGQPVLFQHGLCGDARQTAEMLPGSALYRRICVEARGHGQSPAGDVSQFSIATFADDCASLVREQHLAPVVAAGISMGAAIALRLAVLHPGLVKALVLARPAWSLSAAPANMKPNAEVGALLQQFPPAEAEARFRASPTAQHLAANAPDNLASLLGFFARPDLQTTAALLTRISADGPGVTRQQVSALSLPTLVIGNQRDAIHPMSLAEELASIIPRAKLVEITPKAEDRDRHVADFQKALQDFLKGL